MRYLAWPIRILLFLLLLGFAVKNDEPVTVRYLLGLHWQGPLAFVLLVSFCAGAALGAFALIGRLLRQRREIAELRRELRAAAEPASPPAREIGPGTA